MTAVLDQVQKRAEPLTKRWYPLNPIPEYAAMWDCRARFVVNPAGRRSGKTENWKRITVTGTDHRLGALTYDLPFDDGWFVMTAPTHKQAKRIFWRDLKSLIPAWAKRKVSESELTVTLYNGVEVTVLGMDAPERIEGRSIDGIVADEYANMKKEVWYENIYPALSTLGRPGWAALIGVPEGRNHYYELWRRAKDGTDENWGAFTWLSERVLPLEIIAQAKRDLDELTYQQEYCGSFINFTGRAYYSFGEHNLAQLRYDPAEPLVFCFDFNRSPGVAVVCQEQTRRWYEDEHGQVLPAEVEEEFTAIIGEVHIPRHSNTVRVCDRLIKDWGDHEGLVYLYGDSTGGAKGTQSVAGSDWDLIEERMASAFGERALNRNPRSNPRERVRVNAVNSRCRAAAGNVRVLLDQAKAPRTYDDLEGTITLEGGAGEIDKDSDPAITHLSDAFGYYLAEAHPVGADSMEEVS